MTKGSVRRPGRRSKLPSRTTTSLWLPRLTNINFASDDVRQPLIDAGWSGGGELNKHVREIVSSYLGDSWSRRVSLPEFRVRINKLSRAVDSLLKKFPDEEVSPADSAIIEAINRELDGIDAVEKAPDFHFVRDGLRALLEATKRVRDAESGPGTDANRKAYELVGGLAHIYFDYTGKKPSASINGRFARFVDAVNALIPERFQLNGLESLIRAVVDRLILPPNSPS